MKFPNTITQQIGNHMHVLKYMHLEENKKMVEPWGYVFNYERLQL